MGEGPEHNPFAPPAESADFEVQAYARGTWLLATYWQRFAGQLIDNLLYVVAIVPGAFFVSWDRFVEVEKSGDPMSSELIALYVPIFLGPLLLGSYQLHDRIAGTIVIQE